MNDANSARGPRFYDDATSVESYLAHRHAEVSSPNLVMEDPAFTAEIGDVAGLRILDLGCGDGTFAATCLDQGCSSFVGVDGSDEMIRRARRQPVGPEVTFIADTMEGYRPSAATFDLVTSRMALHYVEDLAPVLSGVHRALVPGGRLIASVVHPVITASNDAPTGQRQTQVVDNYFNPGPRGREWFGQPVTWYHRTIEQYLSLLADAGLSLTALRECEPVRDLFGDDHEEYERRRRVPVFLLLHATRSR